jgi:hypothetical protein
MFVSPLVPHRMMLEFSSAPTLPPQFVIAGVAEQTFISCPAGRLVVIAATDSNILARCSIDDRHNRCSSHRSMFPDAIHRDNIGLWA